MTRPRPLTALAGAPLREVRRPPLEGPLLVGDREDPLGYLETVPGAQEGLGALSVTPVLTN